MSRYANILRVLSEKPWAITRPAFEALRALVELRASGERLADEVIAANLAEYRETLAADQRRGRRRSGAVAVVPLYGPIFPKANLMAAMSGATSLQQFRADVQGALDDEDVASILIDIDSPGGVVDGLTETASFLRAAREVKPIVAIGNGLACSAAYWMGSQASEFVITPSAIAGDIGVFMPHTEFSKMDEELGITNTVIRAGKYKHEVNDTEPLTPVAKEHLQAEVDYYYDLFVRDVALGRSVKPAAVRAGFGEGRSLNAKPAVVEGIADRVESIEETLARMVKGGARLGAPSPRSVLEQPTVAELEAEGQRLQAEREALIEAGANPAELGEVEPVTPVEGPTAEYFRLRARRRDRPPA